MKQLGELQESRNELLSRVSNLKRDLQDWRFKLDNQVKSYRSELGDLRKTLNTEVGSLRKEFQDLRATLKQQLEATAATPSFCRVAEESEMRWTVDSLRTRAMTHQQQAYFPSI